MRSTSRSAPEPPAVPVSLQPFVQFLSAAAGPADTAALLWLRLCRAELAVSQDAILQQCALAGTLSSTKRGADWQSAIHFAAGTGAGTERNAASSASPSEIK